MIILGVDPGIASVGYGAIRFDGNHFVPLEYATFRTAPDPNVPGRLKLIFDFLSGLIMKYKVEVMSVEEIFFEKNVKTAITVSQARGVILLAGANAGIPVYEYTPLQVKQAVVGYGKADKKQVQQMVKAILGLKDIPKPDDTADALAMAICHAHCSNSLRF